jgi:diguanylate cyclase (GGDEF)-like protein
LLVIGALEINTQNSPFTWWFTVIVLFNVSAMSSTIFAQSPQQSSLENNSSDINLPKTNQSRPIVTYCIDPDWMPYEAIRNNQHVGMSAEYMNFIAEQAQIDFRLVKTTTWGRTLELLKSGECEVASLLNRTPAREEYLLFTQPFFFGPNVMVSNEENSFLHGYENIGDRRLGVVENYRNAEYIATYYPNIDLHVLASEGEGLEKVLSGELDLFIGSMLSINVQIQNRGLHSLRIVGWAEPQDKLSMGISNRNYALQKKLNAAVEAIPEKLHVQIYKEWNSVREIDDVNYRVLWIAGAIFSIILLLGFWRNRIIQGFNDALIKKNQQLETLQDELIETNRALEVMSMRDQLTSLYNRHFISKRIRQEQSVNKRSNLPVSLVLFDIDHFKFINDQFGHSVGDEVLKEVALRVLKTIRDVDFASRWGGEEFLILCPQTKLNEARELAIRLQFAFARSKFEKVGKITCSFGVAEYKANDSFTEWFDQADKRLYAAKEAGRDRIVCE